MKVRYYEKRPGAWHLDFKDPNGARCRPYGGTTEAEAVRNAPRVIAETLLARQVAKAPARPTVVLTGPTIEATFKLGLRTHKGWIEAKDRKGLEGVFYSMGLPLDMPVAALTRDKVRALREQWLKAPGKVRGTTLAASTINHRLSMLSVLLKVADLPPHGVEHLSVNGNRRTRRLSAEERKAIQVWCIDNRERRGAQVFAILVETALETAARLSELLGLTWGNVGEDTARFLDTKNGEDRTIPLTPRAKSLLRAARGLPGASGHGPFDSLTVAQVGALWDRMRRDMGLEGDDEFVFHMLRHEAISTMADRGASAFGIAAVAGHKSISTTQRYVKAGLGSMREALGIGTDAHAG